jgi:4-phospho-D-threonate 3-dehydrogenase / 4-phospho-D-erythronate 3-dehydrogenase
MERLFAMTMGDASGVGPEILLKAFGAGIVKVPIVVFGDLEALEYYNQRLDYGISLRRIANPMEFTAGPLNVIDSGIMSRPEVSVGRLSARSGHAAREYVVAAARAAIAGQVAAVVTLPMNKEATQLSDPHFTGHTELIGEVCGVKDVTIMLVSEQLVVTHVSTHMSLSMAIASAKRERILTIIRLTCEAMLRFKESPRIAVAGLNPHAGENGLFGDEEIKEIRPAVEEARSQGLPVDGPFAPDTLFYLAVRKKQFDAIVCMYHDQGHVPLKLLDFEGGVNVTLGLPIIRTSVDHGTAFDIAGRGVASTASFIHAVDLAVKLAEGEKKGA